MPTRVGFTSATISNWLSSAAKTVAYSLVTASGNDRALFVIVSWEAAAATAKPTGVSYAGQAMSLLPGSPGGDVVVTDSFQAGVQVWFLGDADLPASAGSNDVSITFDENGGTSAQAGVGVVELTGANQSIPANLASNTALSVAAIAANITPANAGSLLLAGVVLGAAANVFVDQGTQIYEQDSSSSTGAAHEYSSGATAEVAMGVTFSGTINRTAFIAWEVLPPAPATQEPVVGVGQVPVPRLVRGAGSVAGVAAQPTPSLVRGVAPVQAVAETPAPSLRRAVAPLSVVAELPTSTLRRAVSSVAGVGVQTAPSLIRKVASVTGVGQLPLTGPSGPALHRINCGGAEHTAAGSIVWDADRDFSTPSNTFSTADPIAGTTEDALYQSERSTSASGGTHALTYTLDVPAATPVLVRFHLAEVWHTLADQRKFSIEIDGVVKATELDLVAVAGHDVAYVLEFPVTTTGTSLEATVRNGTEDRAKLNALEVVLDDGATPSVTGGGELPPPSLVRGVAPVVGVGQLPAPSRVSSVPSVTGVGVVPEPTPAGDLTVQVSGMTQFTAAVGGSPTPSGFTVIVTNESDATIRFEAKACCDWLMLTDYFGSLDPAESIMIGVIADTDELAEGAYSALVCVCSRESHDHAFHAIPVRAEIGTPATAVATRYIDYDTGDDSNDGLTEGAPWQHLPMDANATGNAASHSEAAGHEFILKGGVHYRGRLVLGADGSSGSRIVVDGNTRGTWGTGPAIIDGSELIGGWTDNLDGTFTADISAAKWFDKTARGLRPFDGDRLMTAAQWPVKQPEKFRYDDMTSWQIADSTTSTSATWSGFAALPADAFDGTVYIQCWRDDNRVHTATVTGFNPGTNTVTFSPALTWTTSQDHRFVLTNSPAFLTDPGEFVIDDVAETITAIPYDGTPDEISGSTVFELVDMLGDYWHLRGLILQRAGGSSDYQGSAIASFTGASSYTRIEGCQVRWCPSQRGTIDFRAIHTGTEIEGCALYQNILGRDIQIVSGDGGSGQQDALIRNNVLFASGGTGIYSSACNGVEVDNNLVVRDLAVHGNGISLYAGTYDGRITRNRVVEGNIAISIQINSDMDGGENCLVAHNFCELKSSFLGYGSTLAVYSLSQSAGIQILNNTLINPYGQALSLGTHAEYSQPLLGIEIRNNIIEGANGGVNPSAGLGITTSNNHFLAEWDSTYPYDATDLMEMDKSVIFADHANGDYTLAPGSPCIDTGYDTGLTLVPAVGQRDRGAFEYSESDYVAPVVGVGVLPVPRLVRGVAPVVGVGVVPESTDQVPSVTGVGQVPIPKLVRKVDPVSAVGELPVPTLARATAPLVGVPVLPAVARISHPPAVVGVGQLPLTVDQPVAPVVGVGVLPVPRLIRKVAPLVGVGVVPETNELLMEPVPEYMIARAQAALERMPGTEWIRYYPSAGGSKTIRARVLRDTDYSVAGNNLRFPASVIVSLHPTKGVALPQKGDEMEFARFKGGQPERFRVGLIASSGRSGLWKLETVAGYG